MASTPNFEILAVKDLKKLLDAAGIAFDGVVEKAELVKLLQNAHSKGVIPSATLKSVLPSGAGTDADFECLPVKDLKRLLDAAGISFIGVSEKSELVKLLKRVTARRSMPTFVAAAEWRQVPPGVALPPGLEVRFDLSSGRNFARLAPDATRREPASPHRPASSQGSPSQSSRPAPACRAPQYYSSSARPLAIKDGSVGRALPIPSAGTDSSAKRGSKRRANDMDFDFDDPFFNSPQKKSKKSSLSQNVEFDLDYWSKIVEDIIRKRKKPKAQASSPSKASHDKGRVVSPKRMSPCKGQATNKGKVAIPPKSATNKGKVAIPAKGRVASRVKSGVTAIRGKRSKQLPTFVKGRGKDLAKTKKKQQGRHVMKASKRRATVKKR